MTLANLARLNVPDTAAQATATATVNGGFITGATVTSQGNGYVTPPTITVNGPNGSGAILNPIIVGTKLIGVTVQNPGSSYSLPTLSVSAPGLYQQQVFTGDNVFIRPLSIQGIEVGSDLLNIIGTRLRLLENDAIFSRLPDYINRFDDQSIVQSLRKSQYDIGLPFAQTDSGIFPGVQTSLPGSFSGNQGGSYEFGGINNFVLKIAGKNGHSLGSGHSVHMTWYYEDETEAAQVMPNGNGGFEFDNRIIDDFVQTNPHPDKLVSHIRFISNNSGQKQWDVNTVSIATPGIVTFNLKNEDILSLQDAKQFIVHLGLTEGTAKPRIPIEISLGDQTFQIANAGELITLPDNFPSSISISLIPLVHGEPFSPFTQGVSAYILRPAP
jgi:hypothetical protein